MNGVVAGDVQVYGFASIDGAIGGLVRRYPGGQLYVGPEASLQGGYVEGSA